MLGSMLFLLRQSLPHINSTFMMLKREFAAAKMERNLLEKATTPLAKDKWRLKGFVI